MRRSREGEGEKEAHGWSEREALEGSICAEEHTDTRDVV